MKLKSVLLTLISSLTLALFAIASLALIAHAADPWYVSPTGSNGNSCLSVAAPCQTIAAAIDKAAPGDTIIVTAGTYTENLILTKTMTLQGAGANSTLVDGNAAGSVFSITTGINVILMDLTITNGRTTEGAGIRNAGTLTLYNCVISGNTAIGKNGTFNEETGISTDGTSGMGGALQRGYTDSHELCYHYQYGSRRRRCNVGHGRHGLRGWHL